MYLPAYMLLLDNSNLSAKKNSQHLIISQTPRYLLFQTHVVLRAFSVYKFVRPDEYY